MYIFDTNVFLEIFRAYYPSIFPALWDKFNAEVAKGTITSVRNVRPEMLIRRVTPRLDNWIKQNKNIFTEPSVDEQEFVKHLTNTPAGRGLIKTKETQVTQPQADLWLIAKAHVLQKTKKTKVSVVTMESRIATSNNPGMGRIPDVCDGHRIRCINLEQFMSEQNWMFR